MTAPPEIAEQRAVEPFWAGHVALAEHFEPSHKGDDQ